MLGILNNLSPFFEDCHRELGVREYARLAEISPPTASKLLSQYEREGLLVRSVFRRHHLYRADRGSRDFIVLSRLYWQARLKPLLDHLEGEFLAPPIVLFGSLARAETRKQSDVDLLILAEEQGLDISGFERKLGREIQIFFEKSIEDVKNRDLAAEMVNGHVLRGELFLGPWTGKNAARKASSQKRGREKGSSPR